MSEIMKLKVNQKTSGKIDQGKEDDNKINRMRHWNKNRYSILKTTKKNYQQVYANKIENLDEMAKFLKNFQGWHWTKTPLN